MQLESVRVAIAVAATAYLAYEDYRTSFMDQRLLYAMVGAGLLLDLLTLDQSVIVPAFIGCGLIFGVGYYYYRRGEIGGGDVLLLCGIHALLPQAPTIVSGWVTSRLGLLADPSAQFVYSNFTQAIPFAVSVLVAATLLGLIGTSVHYARKLWGRPLKPDRTTGTLALAVAVAVMAASVFYLHSQLVPELVYLCAFAPAVFLTAFSRQIRDEAVAKKTPVSDILDEDVLLTELMDQRIVAKYGLQRVVTKAELEKLKKVSRTQRIKAFPIARDLPRFGPYLFAGLVLSILFGNPLVLLMLAH
jgi:prepilin signal peptidase PulO-like enzyme (type II secretory pathway)